MAGAGHEGKQEGPGRAHGHLLGHVLGRDKPERDDSRMKRIAFLPFNQQLMQTTVDERAGTADAVTDIRQVGVPSVQQARLLVLAAAVLWSTSGFFVKSPYLAGWTGPRLAFWRAAFACLILWPLVRRPKFSWK